MEGMVEDMQGGKVVIQTSIFRNEETIPRAIESVLNQTYRDLELHVFCGEKTVDVIQNYANRDARVIIHYTDNLMRDYYVFIEELKQSTTRWYGLLDGDDWYEIDFLEKSISFAIDNKLDIVACGYNEIDLEGKCREKQFLQESLVCQMEETDKWFIEGWRYFATFWGNLYAVSTLRNFDENSRPDPESFGRRGADALHSYALLSDADRIGFLNECVYNYQQTVASETFSIHPNRKYAPITILHYVADFLKKINPNDFASLYFLYTQYGAMLLEEVIITLNSNIEPERKYSDIKEILSKEETYILYNLTIRTRRDQFQNLYMNAIYTHGTIFEREQFKELVKCIYPQIEVLIPEEQICYDNFEKVKRAKETLIDLLLQRN